jgi:hypothetical protein
MHKPWGTPENISHFCTNHAKFRTGSHYMYINMRIQKAYKRAGILERFSIFIWFSQTVTGLHSMHRIHVRRFHCTNHWYHSCDCEGVWNDRVQEIEALLFLICTTYLIWKWKGGGNCGNSYQMFFPLSQEHQPRRLWTKLERAGLGFLVSTCSCI